MYIQGDHVYPRRSCIAKEIMYSQRNVVYAIPPTGSPWNDFPEEESLQINAARRKECNIFMLRCLHGCSLYPAQNITIASEKLSSAGHKKKYQYRLCFHIKMVTA